MEHSLQAYLARQSTDCLLLLLGDYAEQEDPHDQSIYAMILQILTQRGIVLPSAQN